MSEQDRIETEENEVEAHKRRHLNDERQGGHPAAGDDAGTESASDDFELHGGHPASPNPASPNPA